MLAYDINWHAISCPYVYILYSQCSEFHYGVNNNWIWSTTNKESLLICCTQRRVDIHFYLSLGTLTSLLREQNHMMILCCLLGTYWE